MDSSEGKEEPPKSQPDVDFIPSNLLEESGTIGEGEFGRKCIHKPTNEKRALFMVPSKPEEWFTTVFASAFRLKHDNIIRIYGRTCVDGVNGILTEWVEGMSLKQVIHDKSIDYTLADVLLWNIQSFSALEYINKSFPGKENEHFRRYFNRIVCAENMILNPTRDVLKICALGLFKHIPDPKDSTETNYSYYWAPEVWDGEYRYEESDVYPFGFVLSECLNRKEPIISPKPIMFQTNKQTKSIMLKPITLLHGPVQASLMFHLFIKKCTNRRPSERRSSISEIKNILENMTFAEKKQNLDVFKYNAISFWNDEEFYYCKKLSTPQTFRDEEIKQVSKIFSYNSLKNLKVLARGSFGQVWSAEYEGRIIAVKFQTAMKMAPFLQEFGALIRLEHENIVKVIGQTEHVGVYGIVMEYIDGTSLHKIIHESPKKYTLGDVLKWNYQAASALDYMHSSGRCLHRDVKPQNMLIENSEKRTLKLVDLGGAKRIHNSLNFTEMGTELYIAPEIDNNDPYNEKCDVYSWTITFWECCTAQKPQRPAEYQIKVNQICSAKLVKIIEQFSSSDPSERKPMFVIKKWLGDMLKHRKAFTDTDSTFRENHICVWNEQTDELYYFPETINVNTEAKKRFKKYLTEAKTLFENVPMNTIKMVEDLTEIKENVKIIKTDEKQKVLKLLTDADEKYLENEFVIHSKLKHENILKVVGYIHDNELHYFGIITEYLIEGKTLEKVINGGGVYKKFMVKWGLKCARALEYMHSQNILHCDFKPANIIVGYYLDCCQITGFKHSRDLQYSHPKEAVGTGIYMAPEVRRDGLLTTKSDVYSWTVTFWEMCRRQYFFEDNIHKALEDIRQMESIDLCDEGKRYQIENGSDKFNDFIRTCANADQDKRWSFANIIKLLENMLNSWQVSGDSNYQPNFDNIQADMVVKDNICLWNHEDDLKVYDPNSGLWETYFLYAPVDFPLDSRNRLDEFDHKTEFKKLKKLHKRISSFTTLN